MVNWGSLDLLDLLDLLKCNNLLFLALNSIKKSEVKNCVY